MTSFNLKILACLFMLIDHIGYCIFPNITLFRIIGRLSFPLFAFQIAEGYKHTKNKKKYFIRMFIFALVSQLPYFIFRDISGYSAFSLNIGFTFCLSIIALYFIELARNKNTLLILPAILVCFIAYFFKVDYSWYGIMLVTIFYVFDITKNDGFLFTFLCNIFFSLVYILIFNAAGIQLYGVLALVLLSFYNGKKGTNIKYFFYAFYPLHLMLISMIKYLI